MQKGVFLLAMGGPQAWRGLYDFSPYNWGPYSDGLAADLDRLRAENILRVAPVPGSRYGQYVPTAPGQELASELWSEVLDDEEREFLQQVRHYVTSRSFDRLLTDVYSEYPEYATESLFRPWRGR
jgi:hypothetical protein